MPYFTKRMVLHTKKEKPADQAPQPGSQVISQVDDGHSYHPYIQAQPKTGHVAPPPPSSAVQEAAGSGTEECTTSAEIPKSSPASGAQPKSQATSKASKPPQPKAKTSTGKGSSSSKKGVTKVMNKAPPTQKTRQLRVIPSYVPDLEATAVSCYYPQGANEGLTIDDKRLKYMKSLLKNQVEQYQKERGALPAEGKPYKCYIFEKNEPLQLGGSKSQAIKTRHVDYPELTLVTKVYRDLSAKVPNVSTYLKMMRQLGKKHPYILGTWEIFDKGGTIMIIQEYANRFDLGTYLSKHGRQSEKLICQWARQLHRALDFLGDMGICHRSIKPSHVLLMNSELQVRLTGFYDSIIYWSLEREDIANVPCIKRSKKSHTVPDYQAPEVYGNPETEEFDPIIADIWSYGATVYFTASLAYPHEITKENPKIEQELQANIKKMENASALLKNLLSGMLTTNATVRFTFDRIAHHRWFTQN